MRIISERPPYPDDPATGDFGMFFLNSEVGYISLEGIDYIEPADTSPNTYLVAIGPMTWKRDGCEDVEIFDPYMSGTVDTLDMRDIFINGKRVRA